MGSKSDDRKTLNHLRSIAKKRSLTKIGGIILTERDADAHREQYCAGCGKKKKNSKQYFGEEFCGDCVEKFKAGK